jgi:hypothetical protein
MGDFPHRAYNTPPILNEIFFRSPSALPRHADVPGFGKSKPVIRMGTIFIALCEPLSLLRKHGFPAHKGEKRFFELAPKEHGRRPLCCIDKQPIHDFLKSSLALLPIIHKQCGQRAENPTSPRWPHVHAYPEKGIKHRDSVS